MVPIKKFGINFCQNDYHRWRFYSMMCVCVCVCVCVCSFYVLKGALNKFDYILEINNILYAKIRR